MFHQTEPVRRLTDPDFRRAEVAIRRAAEKAQRQIREAGFEPVVRIPETISNTNEEAKSVFHIGICQPEPSVNITTRVSTSS